MPSYNTSNNDFHSNENDNSQKSSNKSFKRMYYPSNKKGEIIVNAVTGEPYQWRNGTVDSLRLFCVTDSTGKCDQYGFYDRRGDHRETFNKEPNTLYYDGPNEYMEHRKIKLDPELVSEWNNTRTLLFNNDGDLNMEVFRSLKASGKIKALLKH